MTAQSRSGDPLVAHGGDQWRWALFAALWGWALLMHQATFDRWQYSPLGWAICLLAMGLVLAPRSLALLGATVTVNAVYSIQCLPHTANHLVFEGMVSLSWSAAIGAHLLGTLRRGRSVREAFQLEPGTPHPLEPSRRPLQLALLLVYWLSVLHKLNYDFVDPGTSCASYMYRRVASALPLLPQAEWAERASIWGTLIAEAALPALLLWRYTWRVGLIAALAFHLLLAFDPTPGIYSFTGLLFAMFVLTVPNELVDAALSCWAGLVERVGRWRMKLARGACLVVVGAILLYGASRTDQWAFRAGFVFFLLWAGAVILGYSFALAKLPGRRHAADRAGREASPPRLATARSPAWLWALPALVLLTGLNPYLGLRTQLSFSMFSNLRTEGGVSNHLFMPRLASFWGYQDDLVEILQTDDADLAEYPRRQLLLPYFEFRRLVSGLPDITVTYQRGGIERTFQCEHGRCNDAELAEPFSGWLGRLLYFRPVDKGPHMSCRH